MDMDFLFLFVAGMFIIQQFVNVEAKGQIRSSKTILNPIFSDLKIQETAVRSSKVRNKIQCSSLCQGITNCRSLSYNKVTQMCVLFDKDFTDVSSTANVMEAGWQYFYLIKDPEQRGADCVGQSLPIICSLYCLSYIIRPAPVLVADLAGICESYSGGEMIKIDRELKQYCVEQLLGNKSNGDVFIQGKRNESDNIWRFDDGTEMAYFNWNTARGQPDNRAGEIDVVVRKIYGYVWHDMYGVDVNAAVCQQT